MISFLMLLILLLESSEYRCLHISLHSWSFAIGVSDRRSMLMAEECVLMRCKSYSGMHNTELGINMRVRVFHYLLVAAHVFMLLLLLLLFAWCVDVRKSVAGASRRGHAPVHAARDIEAHQPNRPLPRASQDTV